MMCPALPTSESSSLNVWQLSKTRSASAANSSELVYLGRGGDRPVSWVQVTAVTEEPGQLLKSTYPPRSSRSRMVEKSIGFLMMRRYPLTNRGFTGSRKGQAASWDSISIKIILLRKTVMTALSGSKHTDPSQPFTVAKIEPVVPRIHSTHSQNVRSLWWFRMESRRRFEGDCPPSEHRGTAGLSRPLDSSRRRQLSPSGKFST